METHFDEPVTFTLNSTYVKPATKTKLVAEVGIKNYKPRFPMRQVATDVYQADFRAILDKNLRDALVLQPFTGGG